MERATMEKQRDSNLTRIEHNWDDVSQYLSVADNSE